MNDIMTIDDAVAYTHVSKPGLARLRFLGQGPKYMKPTPKTVLYRRAWLDEWLEASTHEPSQPKD